MHQLFWTVASQHLRGAVKAVEMELVGRDGSEL